jgi:hypothetical protein
MNRQEYELVLQVYEDCVQLENRNELTEFGQGELSLCRLLLLLAEAKRRK